VTSIISTTPAGSDPRPEDDPPVTPSRTAAMQRRATQAAISNTVRAMRTTGGRRLTWHRPGNTPTGRT
jgi:hypothetical protein